MTYRHCEKTQREHWHVLPCSNLVVVTYVDEDGVLHSFCVEHRSVGVTEAAWHKWVIAVPVVA